MLELALTPQNSVYVLGIALSALFGMIIGYEREKRGKRTGTRTFALICVGSCVFTIMSINAFGDADKARVAAQIITGIGFLGGAVIWKEGEKIIHGVTTAADIWASAAVGMAIGAGYYFIAAVTTVMTMAILNIRTKYDEST